MNNPSLEDQIITAASMLEDAQSQLEKMTQEMASTEREYRREKAKAFLAVSGAKNATEREALAEAARVTDVVSGEALSLSDLRYKRDLSEGMRSAALEYVRSRRTILSALQTLANLAKSEADFARTGPETRT